MKIAVRMDDISPGMDMEKFNRFYRVLKKYGIMPLLGVVPDNQDAGLDVCPSLGETDFFESVKKWQMEGCVIAMHGYSHVYSTSEGGLFPLNHFSEFAGLPIEEQRKKILSGKQIFEKYGISTDIFMAPGHSYDRNTLTVLKECGFNCITDGFGKIPYERKKLVFFPISFSREKTLAGGKGYSTLVFHVNTMKEEDFEKYEFIFRDKKEMFVPYREYLKVKPKNRSIFGSWKEWAMADAKHFLVKLREKL